MKLPPFKFAGSPMNLDYYLPFESKMYSKVLSKLSDNKRVAIDIGSCEGLWSLNLSDEFKTVYAFEPMPDVYGISLRWLPENVKPHNIGLSNVEENIEMVFFEHNVGMTMRKGNAFIEDHMKNSPSKIFVTKTRTLDSYEFQNVDFIKIDAEGEEQNIIYGATETLDRCSPIIFVDSDDEIRIDGYTQTEKYFFEKKT